MAEGARGAPGTRLRGTRERRRQGEGPLRLRFPTSALGCLVQRPWCFPCPALPWLPTALRIKSNLPSALVPTTLSPDLYAPDKPAPYSSNTLLTPDPGPLHLLFLLLEVLTNIIQFVFKRQPLGETFLDPRAPAIPRFILYPILSLFWSH